MSYLRDTSSFLWFVSGDTRLSNSARTILENSIGEVFLSMASVWELAIKANLRRGLELPRPFPAFIDEELEEDRSNS